MGADVDGQALPQPVNAPIEFDFGLFILVATTDGKIILTPREGPKHLTIHLGGKSGILDAHLTTQGAERIHEPLGGIRTDDLATVFEQAKPVLERDFVDLVQRVLRPVRFGWLRHHGIYTYPSVFDERAMRKLGTFRGRRWRLDEGRLAKELARPLSRKDVEFSSSVAFLLFRWRASSVPYGALIKFAESSGRCRYAWFRTDRVMAEVHRLWCHYEPLVRQKLLTGREVADAIARHQG